MLTLVTFVLLVAGVAGGDWERVWSIAHAPERLAWETRNVGGWLSVTNDVLQPRVLTEDGMFFDGPEWELTAVRTAGATAPETDVMRQVATYFPSHNHTVVVIGDQWYTRADVREFGPLPAEVLVRRGADGQRSKMMHTSPSSWNYVDLVAAEQPTKPVLGAASKIETDTAIVLARRYTPGTESRPWPGEVVTVRFEKTGECFELRQFGDLNFPPEFVVGARFLAVVEEIARGTVIISQGHYIASEVDCSVQAAKPKLSAAASSDHQDVATVLSTEYARRETARHLEVVARLEAAGTCITIVHGKDDYPVGAQVPVIYNSATKQIGLTSPGALPNNRNDYLPVECPKPALAAKSVLGAGSGSFKTDVATILNRKYSQGSWAVVVTARLKNAGICLSTFPTGTDEYHLQAGAQFPVSYNTETHKINFEIGDDILAVGGSYVLIDCPVQGGLRTAEPVLKAGADPMKQEMADVVRVAYPQMDLVLFNPDRFYIVQFDRELSELELLQFKIRPMNLWTATLDANGHVLAVNNEPVHEISGLRAPPLTKQGKLDNSQLLKGHGVVGAQKQDMAVVQARRQYLDDEDLAIVKLTGLGYCYALSTLDHKGRLPDWMVSDVQFPIDYEFTQTNPFDVGTATVRDQVKLSIEWTDCVVVIKAPAVVIGRDEDGRKVDIRLESTGECLELSSEKYVRGSVMPERFKVGARFDAVLEALEYMAELNEPYLLGGYGSLDGYRIRFEQGSCPFRALKGTVGTPYVYIDASTSANSALTLSNGAVITRADGLPFAQPHDHSGFFVDRRIDQPLPHALQQFVDVCLLENEQTARCAEARAAMTQRRYDDLMSLVFDQHLGDGRWLELPTGAEWLRDRDPARSARLDRAVAAWTQACNASPTALDLSPTSCTDFMAATDKNAALGFPTESPASTTATLPPWGLAVIVAGSVLVVMVVVGGVVARSTE